MAATWSTWAIVLMFIGFTGSAFNQHETSNWALGRARIRALHLKLLEHATTAKTRTIVRAKRSWRFQKAATRSTNWTRKCASTNPASNRRFDGGHPPPSERRSVREFSGVLQDNSKAIFQFTCSRWCPGSGLATGCCCSGRSSAWFRLRCACNTRARRVVGIAKACPAEVKYSLSCCVAVGSWRSAWLRRTGPDLTPDVAGSVSDSRAGAGLPEHGRELPHVALRVCRSQTAADHENASREA